MDFKELIQLKNIYDSLEYDNPKLVLVEGIDGSGKSTLLRTFYYKHINDSIRSFVTYDLLSVYEPINMFRKIMDELEKSVSTRFNLKNLLIFEKGDLKIDSLVNDLLTLTNYRKIVIIIDQAESANSQFFGSLLYILRSMQGKRLMVVISYDPFKINEDFRDFLLKTSSLPEKNVVKIKISPLTVEESVKLLEDLGYRLPLNIVEKIHQVSKGNIRTTIQIIEDLKRKDEIDEFGYWIGGFADITMPGKPGLKAIFLKLYGEMNDNTKRIAESASSVGMEFSFRILNFITGFSDEILVNALNELIKKNIVYEKNMNVFEFTDPEFQKILYNEIMTSVKKRYLHKKLGEFYENIEKDVIKCAINFYIAGEKNKAEKYLREGVDIFIKSFNFRNALDFLNKLAELRPHDEEEILLKGFSYFRTGKFNEALETYSQLENTENEDIKVRMIIQKSYVLIYIADFQTIEKIMKNLENFHLNDEHKYHINYIKGFMNLRKNLLNESLKYYEEALSLAQKIQNREYLANVYKDMGNVYYYKSNFEKAYELYNIALKYYLEIGDYSGVAKIYNNLANLILYNNFQDSINNYIKALTYADLAGDESLIIVLHYNLGDLYFSLGKFKDSAREIEIANKFAEMKKDFETRLLIYIFSSDISLYKGDFSQAISNIEKGLEIARKMNSEYNIASLNLRKLMIFSVMGIHIDEKNIINEIEKMVSIDEDLYFSNDAKNAGLVYLYSNRMEESIKVLEKAYEYGKEKLNIIEFFAPMFALSLAYIFSGNYDKFMDIYEETTEKIKNQEIQSIEIIVLRPIYAYLKSDRNEIDKSNKDLLDLNFYFLCVILNTLFYLITKEVKYKENAKNLMEKLGIDIFSKYLE